MKQARHPAAIRLILFVCAAQVLVQIGQFFWPALVPQMIVRWRLTNSEAGWITAMFYAAYILAVPILVTLTDRIDAKRVYLAGVATTVFGHLIFATLADGFWSAMVARALTGIGWAGTYMTGLKLLADQVTGKMMSRAAAGHAASIGLSGALSFACADLIALSYGWQSAFAAAAASAAVAWLIVLFAVPRAAREAKAEAAGHALFDFRPVFRNRSAMAYAIAYCLHTLEMSALRGWGVAFLGFVAMSTGTRDGVLSPAMTLTVLGLIGTLASVAGNEGSIYFGRRTLITVAMLGSAILAGLIGLVATQSYNIAVALMMLYGLVIWLDSSSLTAGTAGSAEPSRRGATLAVHSTLGYLGGFVGPLAVGWILDHGGGNTVEAWRSAFLMIAGFMLAALVAFALMRPRDLAGDRRTA